MNASLLAACLLAFCLFAPSSPAQYGPPPQPGWDAPPPELREFQRIGFHDGLEGARKDIENHRAPNVANRDEFRHPHVPPEVRRDYKQAFRGGYDIGIQHILGGPLRHY